MKTSWKELSSIYIGTVIGAGFASGQEIIQFFGVFGYRGIFGVILAMVLFSFIGATVLSQVYNYKITSYSKYIGPIFGKKLSKVLEFIIISYLFVGFCVMLAGSGAIFEEWFNISADIGIYTMAVLCFITLTFSVKGISIVNRVLVPFLIIGIVLVGLSIMAKEGLVFSNSIGVKITNTGNWITSAILYVSYNSIPSIAIMTTLLPIIKNKRQAIKGGVLGGIGLGIMAIFILLTTLILYTDIYNIEIPMARAAQYLGKLGGYAYTIILWFAMFTTAISSGYGCINKVLSIIKENRIFVSAVFCIIATPFAKIGFSKLVSVLYPFFGHLGLIMILYIILNQVLNILGIGRRSFYRE